MIRLIIKAASLADAYAAAASRDIEVMDLMSVRDGEVLGAVAETDGEKVAEWYNATLSYPQAVWGVLLHYQRPKGEGADPDA